MNVLRPPSQNFWSNAAKSWSLVLLAAATPLLCSCRSLSNPTTNASANSNRNGRAAQVVSRDAFDARRVAAIESAVVTPPSPALLATHHKIAAATKPSDGDVAQVAYHPPALPPNVTTGAPLPPGWKNCLPGEVPLEGTEYLNPWTPDGLPGPWPYDEYIWDGGDQKTQVQVHDDWTVNGLDMEDTVAHYDTRDGRRLVEPSNRVPIYAPRFAAVRKVYGVETHEVHNRVAGVENPVRLNSQEATRIATTALQPVQPVLQHGLKTPVNFRDRTRGIVVENLQRIVGIENGFLPHEDLLLIRRGEYDVSEKARLAERTQAAFIWGSNQMSHVLLEGRPATEAVAHTSSQETSVYELPPGKSRLRICKVASKSEALPGEEIDFTLRFDNVGDQRIGNVTIVDSLTTRLVYIPDSAQCSLKADFGTQENEGESLVLRWEIIDPLEVGEGGIIRFKCKLR